MLSIRAKLTLWYLAVAAAVLLAFAIAIYLYLSRGLLATIDTSLWNQADRIAQGVGHPSIAEEMSQPAVLMLTPQFVSIVNQEGRVTDQILDIQGHEVPVSQATIDRAAREWKPQYEEA